MIRIFSKVAYWSIVNKEAVVYGQYDQKPPEISVTSKTPIEFDVAFCGTHSNFSIKIRGELSADTVYVINGMETRLDFPFETNTLLDTSTIISTMCKDYTHRLDEWIRYNFKLGFTAIIIFNNDANKVNPINESWTLRDPERQSTESMEQIASKYPGRVLLVDFPYSPFPNNLYDTIQRITLTVAIHAFRYRSNYICLIDADEFIYIPSQSVDQMSIQSFLKTHSTSITMSSKILTNRGNMDVINNNVIRLATYLGEKKYEKLILKTDDLVGDEFIVTPHKHSKAIVMPKEVILHYHCWLNTRYDYKRAMPKVDVLQRFMAS